MTAIKNRFLLLLLFFWGHIFVAQNVQIDSLEKSLKTVKNDKQKVLILKGLVFELYTYDIKRAFNHSKEALELAQKINYDLGIGYGYQSMGFCYSMMSNNVRALEYFDKADNIFSELKDQKGICLSDFGIGNLFSRMGNNAEAIVYYKKALKIAKSEGLQVMIAKIWDQMSMAYRRNGQFAESIYYAKKSLDIDIKLKDSMGIAASFVNLGIANYSLRRYPESQEFFRKAFALLKDDQNYIRAMAEYHSGSGLYLMASGMPDNAAKRAYLNQAASHLKEGIAIFGKLKNVFLERKNYIELYKVAKALNNSKLADECSSRAFMLGDKILEIEKEEFVIGLSRERAARKAQIESENKSKLIICGAVGVSLIILLLVFYMRKHSFEKKANNLLAEKNAEIEKLNEQKDRFYSIIAHDLRGAFGGFQALTEFLADEIDGMEKEQIKESAVVMKESAESLFDMLEKLLEWTRSEQSLMEFNPQLFELSQAIGHTIGQLSETAYKKDIEILASVKEDLTVYADQNILETVLRNLVSNAIKFTPRGGTVEVKTEIDALQNVEIQVSDTGIGMNPQMIKDLFNTEVKTNRPGTENEPTTGLGMILCKDFVEKNGGKIWVESEEGKGTVFRFNIPSQKQCIT